MLPKVREMISHYVDGATEGAIKGLFKYSTPNEIREGVNEYRREIQEKQLALMQLENYLKGYEYINNILEE